MDEKLEATIPPHVVYTPSVGYGTTNLNAKYTINIRKALDKKIEAADENPLL